MIIIQPFTTQSQLLTTLKKKPFENIVGKGENAGDLHFLLFPAFFLPFPPPPEKFTFSVTFIFSSADPLNLNQPRILLFGKELKHSVYEWTDSITPVYDDKILALCKLETFADNNFIKA